MKGGCLHVAVAVIRDEKGNILISLRHKSAHQGGLWEFPGGKIELGETVEQALIRELKEELSISLKSASPLIQITHQYPDLKVLLDVWTVTAFSGTANGNEGQKIKWVCPEQLIDYQFPEANYPIITAVTLPSEYAILNGDKPDVLLSNLNKILNNQVKLIQLRLKSLSSIEAKVFVELAVPLCKKQGAKLLLNSAIKGIDKINYVDGIHLTANDLLALNHKPAGHALVCASCHNQQELQHAENIGVDFVVLAPVLATKTHPDVKPLGWKTFKLLAKKVNLPIFALGGLPRSDKTKAKALGAQGIAGVSAFLD